MEQTHQRNERLIENKIWKYLLPGIMMSLALQLGNIVDTVFVGNFLGTEAMSAITLVLPMETLIQVTGYCLGMGGSIAAGILLGRRNKEGASQLFSITLLITVVVGLIIAAAAPFLAMPIADALAKGGKSEYSCRPLSFCRDAWRSGDWRWASYVQFFGCGKPSRACVCLPDSF